MLTWFIFRSRACLCERYLSTSKVAWIFFSYSFLLLALQETSSEIKNMLSNINITALALGLLVCAYVSLS
jgi:hypothetical protein